MKEHPILFTGPMVKAILEGRKTQTRRIANINSEGCKTGFVTPNAGFVPRTIAEHIQYCRWQIGDLLWVRETCVRFTGCASHGKPWSHVPFALSPDGNPYRALLPIVGNEAHVDNLRDSAACVTVPSIHMPRRASRLTLEITDVRAQRLQEISEEDYFAEGLRMPPADGPEMIDTDSWWLYYFKELWNSINAKRAPWSSNPWVWALTFRVVKP